MATLTWLHLSDLQRCSPRDGDGGNIVLRRLQNDLVRLRDEHGLRPDLIFMTGDLAFGQVPEQPLAEQLDAGWAFLDLVRRLYGLDVENVFLVPGNHDVDRKKIKKPVQHWLHSLAGERNTAEIRALLQDAGSNWRDCMVRLEDYEAFIAERCPHLKDDEGRCIYSVVREVQGLQVGIAGLNSAWSAGTDDDKARLWLGEWQVDHLVNVLERADADVKIALIHHPLNWFVDAEDPKLRPRLEAEFHVLLHGHEHQQWVTTPQEDHLSIAAGAALNRADVLLAYNLVRFDLDTGKGEVWLRCLDRRTQSWKADIVPRKADDGVWRIRAPWAKHKTMSPTVDVEPTREPRRQPRLERLDIENLRTLDQLSLQLAPPQQADTGRWTLLLGDNATGKTTILRAIALACMEKQTATAILELTGSEAPFVRIGHPKATVSLQTSAGEISAAISPNGVSEHIHREDVEVMPGPIFAYGCQRGTAFGGPRRDVEFRAIDAVGTLFDDNARLIHAETWIQGIRLAAHESGGTRRAFFDAVTSTLKAILPGIEDISFDDNAQLWLGGPKIGRSPLTTMSDGYVTTVGWIVDLIARWADYSQRNGIELNGNFQEQMEGIVLIDEIDLHLHPLWQVEIVSTLRQQFPKMSFIATTHNPLTLLGARKGEIHVLRRNPETGVVDVDQWDIPPGTTADDVLTGEWFGLSSTLDLETQDALNRHRLMLRKGVPEGDSERVDLEDFLQSRLRSFQSTSLHRMVQDVAAQLMDEDLRKQTAEERKEIRKRLLKRAREKKREDDL